MREELISKLDKDIHAELTKEEIELLYDLTNEEDRYLFKKYIKNRNFDFNPLNEANNMYNDLIKIYTKDQIARTPEEISINTLVYIGDLKLRIIDSGNGTSEYEQNIIPYNLRYIYGQLSFTKTSVYDFKIEHFDNIEAVLDFVQLSNFKKSEEIALSFENLDNTYFLISNIINSEEHFKKENEKLRKLNLTDIDFILSEDNYKYREVLRDFDFTQNISEEDIIKIINKHHSSYAYLPPEYKYNMNILKEVLSYEPLTLLDKDIFDYIDPSIKDYKKIAIMAVQYDYIRLGIIKSDTDGYKEIALAAIDSNPDALGYVDKTIDKKIYKELALSAVQKYGSKINYVPYEDLDEADYKDIALAAVKQMPGALHFVDTRLKDYKEIAFIAINGGASLSNVPTDIEGYKDIAIAAILNDSTNIYLVPKDIECYDEIVAEVERLKNSEQEEKERIIKK